MKINVLTFNCSKIFCYVSLHKHKSFIRCILQETCTKFKDFCQFQWIPRIFMENEREQSAQISWNPQATFNCVRKWQKERKDYKSLWLVSMTNLLLSDIINTLQVKFIHLVKCCLSYCCYEDNFKGLTNREPNNWKL